MLKKITDRVFYMPGSEETDRPTLGLICGDKYSLVVDSGNSPNHAKEFLDELNKMNIPKVRYLVITHHHWDHVLGIEDMNLVTISHEKTKEKLDEMKEYKWDDVSLDKYLEEGIFNDPTVEAIKKEIPDRDEFTVGNVEITYKDSIEIDLGKVTCIVKAVGGCHTEDSSVVYVPEEGVVFLGDCIYGSMYNGEYGYQQKKVLPMIEKIEKFDADHFIISHEEPYDKKGIDEFWNKLRTAGKIVGRGISSEKAIKRFSKVYHRMPSEDEEFYINCFANVNRAMKK